MTSQHTQSVALRLPTTSPFGYPDQTFDVRSRPHTRGPVLFGTIALAVFAGGFVAWSALAPLSRAAVAPGVIQTEQTRRAIQHLEGGIVREVLVRDGEHVRKGQLLMRLDDIASAGTAASLRAMRWALQAQVARARAELAGSRDIAFADELTAAAATDPYAQEAVQAQSTLFRTRAASLEGQIGVLTLRAREATSQIQAADGQLTSLQRQLDLIETETNDVNSLLRVGLETKPHLYALQRTAAQIIGNKNEALSEKGRAQTQVSEAFAQMASLRDQRMQEASVELRDSAARLVEATEKLRAAEDISVRRSIVAPDDGTVMNVRFYTIGAVVKPGEVVMELSPSHEGLVAEVRIQAHDVDDVYAGMSAEVRFPAFSSRVTPYLEGTVDYVAPDATEDDKTHTGYYRAKVHLTDAQIARLPADEKVIPGMPVQVEIVAGKRTLWQYLTQPLVNSFTRAFREK